MDVAALISLSDDELREKLEENGYNPPPITDDVVREIMRRKLFKLINPDKDYPEIEVSDAEPRANNNEVEFDIHERKRFFAGGVSSTSNTKSGADMNIKRTPVSPLIIFVVVCFVLMNLILAVFIFCRDWLF